MTRLILFLVGVIAAAAGLSWLADRPGSLVVNWQGYEIETSVFRAVILFALVLGAAVMAWSVVRQIWASPASVGRFIHRRRQERGLDALSSGMIAIGAGDRSLATRYAVQARKALPNEPLTHLLRAQAAQLSGDRATSRRIFEAMLSTPDTEQLGLRGLFLEAEREKAGEAARQFAKRALELNPKLTWAFDALFELECKAGDWAGALETLSVGRKHGQIEKPDADRRRAVLLTAQAQALDEEGGQKALDLAAEAHALSPDLVPAAAIAGRVLASRGNTARAAKIIERTWKRQPHPDLATVYAFARPGDSPRDRLERIKRLARSTPHASEGAIALAKAAIEARSWDEARSALAPLIDGRLTQRVCALMARIEQDDKGNAGGVREWLARAVSAPRDPAWTADGVVSETWAPISPVTGALDAFEWRVPVEAVSGKSGSAVPALGDLDDLIALAGGGDGPGLPSAGRSADDFIGPEPGAEARGDTGAGDDDGQRAAMSPAQKPPVRSQAGAGQKSPAGLSEASISLEIEPPAKASPTLGQQQAAPVVPADAPPLVVVQARPVAPVAATGTPTRDTVRPTVLATVGDKRPGRARDSNGFVAPHAPDDPGPEETEEAQATPPPGYASRTAKRQV